MRIFSQAVAVAAILWCGSCGGQNYSNCPMYANRVRQCTDKMRTDPYNTYGESYCHYCLFAPRYDRENLDCNTTNVETCAKYTQCTHCSFCSAEYQNYVNHCEIQGNCDPIECPPIEQTSPPGIFDPAVECHDGLLALLQCWEDKVHRQLDDIHQRCGACLRSFTPVESNQTCDGHASNACQSLGDCDFCSACASEYLQYGSCVYKDRCDKGLSCPGVAIGSGGVGPPSISLTVGALSAVLAWL
jgi:hypothetical protein